MVNMGQQAQDDLGLNEKVREEGWITLAASKKKMQVSASAQLTGYCTSMQQYCTNVGIGNVRALNPVALVHFLSVNC
jgi:hypothetical protein